MTEEQRDRIEQIGAELARLWHLHRIEELMERQPVRLATDRLGQDVFVDYVSRRDGEMSAAWRVEDESHTHYRQPDKALLLNQVARELAIAKKKRFIAPKERVDLRKISQRIGDVT